MEIFIPILLVLSYLFKNQIKGYLGELYLRKLLKTLPEKEYFIINNLLITNNDTTTQIDHVVASIYGIFVIETKNYTGKIYGNEYAEKWSKYILNKKYEFYNPIRQNYAHISALKKHFPSLDKSKFISIIAFSNNVKINVSAKNAFVINFSSVLPTILSHKEKINSYNDIYTIRHILNEDNQTSLVNNISHIKDINEKVANKNLKVTSHITKNSVSNKFICETCGNELIYYPKGRYGAYYSCKICNINISEKKMCLKH